MGANDPGLGRPDDTGQVFLHLARVSCLSDRNCLEQLIGGPLPDPIDPLQLVSKSSLASFLTMKRDAKTMHLIPYPTDELKTVAIVRQPDGFAIPREKKLFFILGQPPPRSSCPPDQARWMLSMAALNCPFPPSMITSCGSDCPSSNFNRLYLRCTTSFIVAKSLIPCTVLTLK